MRTRTNLTGASVLVAGALLGWLIFAGRLTTVLAQDKTGPPTTVGTQLPQPDTGVQGQGRRDL